MRETLRHIDQFAKVWWETFKVCPTITVITTLYVFLVFPFGHSVERGYAYQKEVTIE